VVVNRVARCWLVLLMRRLIVLPMLVIVIVRVTTMPNVNVRMSVVLTLFCRCRRPMRMGHRGQLAGNETRHYEHGNARSEHKCGSEVSVRHALSTGNVNGLGRLCRICTAAATPLAVTPPLEGEVKVT
jgi:hypothetical protein